MPTTQIVIDTTNGFSLAIRSTVSTKVGPCSGAIVLAASSSCIRWNGVNAACSTSPFVVSLVLGESWPPCPRFDDRVSALFINLIEPRRGLPAILRIAQWWGFGVYVHCLKSDYVRHLACSCATTLIMWLCWCAQNCIGAHLKMWATNPLKKWSMFGMLPNQSWITSEKHRSETELMISLRMSVHVCI